MSRAKKGRRSQRSRQQIDTLSVDRAEAKLVATIEATGLADVVESEASKEQLTAKCRVHNEKMWLPIITFILQEEQRQDDWVVHICQHHFLLDDRLVYAWNITFGADPVSKYIDDLCNVIRRMSSSIRSVMDEKPTPPPNRSKSHPKSNKTSVGFVVENGEVVSSPLIGASRSRNQPEGPVGSVGKRSKGAHTIGSKGNQYQ